MAGIDAVRIVVAPDKFKGTMTAAQAAAAIAAGVRAVHPDAEVVEVPVADGGEGTIDAAARAGAEVIPARARDALGRWGDARIGLLEDGRAVVESAEVGLMRIGAEERDPLRASSHGVGDLIAAAIEAGATEVLVGIGGSAWTDGGTGAAAALGWRFFDAAGETLGPGGGELPRLARIEGRPPGVPVVGLCDVDNPLTGERGAARVFGPQKGAGPPEIAALEAGLARLVRFGPGAGDVAGAGAGGGLGYGIVAFLGGRLRPGFETVADLAGLGDALGGADLVVTGEGRLDDASVGGKAPVAVARWARRAGVPCVAAAGEVRATPDALRGAGIARWVSVVDVCGDRARSDPPGALAHAVRSLLGDG